MNCLCNEDRQVSMKKTKLSTPVTNLIFFMIKRMALVLLAVRTMNIDIVFKKNTKLMLWQMKNK